MTPKEQIMYRFIHRGCSKEIAKEEASAIISLFKSMVEDFKPKIGEYPDVRHKYEVASAQRAEAVHEAMVDTIIKYKSNLLKALE